MPRRSYVAEGWRLFHDAIMRAGAEEDYYPPDEPELKGRRYLAADFYRNLSGSLSDLAIVDIEKFGNRADLVKRAVWRWLRKKAQIEAGDTWRRLLRLRNRTQILAGFSEFLANRRYLGGPTYEPANPASVVRFGCWLIREQSLSETSPIESVLWGLALIGAEWRDKGRRGYCELCYRHSSPKGRFCAFHRQSGQDDKTRSQAYVRYRKGRRAAALDEEQNGTNRSFAKSPLMDYETGCQALATILFPMIPLDGWNQERKVLVDTLENAPRVLELIGGSKCFSLSYEALVERLRKHVDPYNFDDFMWWATVWHTEKWLELEATPSLRKRGKGKTTQALVEKAVEMATAGLAKGQIASVLGVAPSTVSTWARRYSKFREASLPVPESSASTPP